MKKLFIVVIVLGLMFALAGSAFAQSMLEKHDAAANMNSRRGGVLGIGGVLFAIHDVDSGFDFGRAIVDWATSNPVGGMPAAHGPEWTDWNESDPGMGRSAAHGDDGLPFGRTRGREDSR